MNSSIAQQQINGGTSVSPACVTLLGLVVLGLLATCVYEEWRKNRPLAEVIPMRRRSRGGDAA